MTRVLLTVVTLLWLAAACQPTVRVEPPKEPITINLNVNVSADVRVKLEQQAERDLKQHNDIFQAAAVRSAKLAAGGLRSSVPH